MRCPDELLARGPRRVDGIEDESLEATVQPGRQRAEEPDEGFDGGGACAGCAVAVADAARRQEIARAVVRFAEGIDKPSSGSSG